MVQIVYLDRLDDLGRKTVNTVGDQPGPIGGDGWSVVSEIPTARLQSSHHYAIWVTGKVCNVRRFGSTPIAGTLQLCLGDGSGVRHPEYLVEVGLNAPHGQNEAIPFAFLVIFSASPAISDPLWGATWANLSPMQLLGRVYRRGDAPTYTGAFDVVDLTWIWADLDAIPSSDQLVTRGVLATPLSPGASPVHLVASSTSVPGAIGDQWLHLWALSYVPGVGAIPAFQVGFCTDAVTGAGFEAKNGTGGELGIGHTGTTVYGVQHHLGGLFAESKTAAAYYPACRGRESQTGSNATGFHRFDCLSIRLTELGNVYISNSAIELALTDWATSWPAPSRFYPLEIAAEGRTWEPWTFATGMPSSSSPIDIWLRANDGEELWASQAAARMLAGPEQVCCVATSSRGLGSGDPGVQYQLAFLEHSATVPSAKTVRDLYLVTLYPVKDPDNQPPDPGDVGPPIEIVPGAESISVASLLDPPLPPNVAGLPEQSRAERHRLTGSTGYRRSWATFIAPRRSWSLQWGPLTIADGDDVEAFLKAHRTFRITPPRGLTAVPVAQTSKIVKRMLDHRRVEVLVDVVELVYTGGS